MCTFVWHMVISSGYQIKIVYALLFSGVHATNVVVK
jgi:hypothetical protein